MRGAGLKEFHSSVIGALGPLLKNRNVILLKVRHVLNLKSKKTFVGQFKFNCKRRTKLSKKNCI